MAGLTVRVLTVNAGSSSLKLRVLDTDDTLLASTDLQAPGGTPDGGAVTGALAGLPARLNGIDAVGHRVVHGGDRFTAPARLDPGVRRQLDDLTHLAPLHQPASLAGIDAVGDALPDVPAVACFDTAFHAGLPPAAATYAVPADWRERYGLRRYGFHGLSHAYATRRAAQLLGADPASLRIVVCHLGSGASLAAVAGGRSVDTTMGFTPLEGLVMATRSGTVDPGALLWLQQQAGFTADDLSDALEHRSGLAGLAGTPDMRKVQAAADEGDARAGLALEVYLHRLRGSIAAMTAALGGLDCLVFTGGVGEHAAPVRDRAAAGLEYLGIGIDPDRNATALDDEEDTDVTAPGAHVRTLVIEAREDLEIAAGVRAVLDPDPTVDRPRGPCGQQP